MTPFLKIVAADLYAKLGGDFQNATIIFPNKRAALFFDEYLWEQGGGRTMWTPDRMTISELFASLSDYTVGDAIELKVLLWEVYQKLMKPTKSLDALWGLMETMLSDFEDIDNNMVDTSQLFVNVSDLKELSDFSFLDKEQREAIEQFFSRYLEGDSHTLLKSQFGKMWKCMPDIYEQYRQALLKDGDEAMVYEGMLKRMVVEALTGSDEGARHQTDERLRTQTYVFIGFNVLNKTEMKLMRYIQQNRKTMFYWDYDNSYTTSPRTGQMSKSRDLLTKYEAGQFIEENMAMLGDELKGQDCFDNMRTPKEITLIQSPTDNAQARYIGTWMAEHVEEGDAARESAIVLCDEHLLTTVIHSIPSPHNGLVPARKVNVTMGYPLKAAPVFSLVQALLELHNKGRARGGGWKYRQVAAVLRHPLMQQVAADECAEKLAELKRGNVLFVSANRFADSPTLSDVFREVANKRLTTYLTDILTLVGQRFGEAGEDLQMQKESLFMAYTTINRLHTLQEKHATLELSGELLSRLILQLLEEKTIPFHGEPAEGIQVMGLLETRNLDFRHVIMLSVNEGQMPKRDKRPSLIPYTLRAAYGMTTIEREVSLYAYYYYRLMQRAESITLLYNSSTDGGSKGEMSRFMLQTLAEKDTLFCPGQKIALRAFTAPSETRDAEAISVKKDTTVMEKLHQRFNGERILSPSAINTYMKCPLRFYLNYVAGLKPEDEVSDDIDKPMFGTIFHDAMHHLYMPYEGKPFHSSEAWALKEDDTRILQVLDNAIAVNLFNQQSEIPDSKDKTPPHAAAAELPPLNGTQLINRHVIKEFIKNQLTADAKMAEELESEGGYWQIISQEQEYKTIYSPSCPPAPEGSVGGELLLGGIIDRLDLLHSLQGDRIRIVDYKTSNKPHSAKTVEELFDPEKCANNYHIMQTLYYCKVLASLKLPQGGLVPALMYCAKDYGKNYSGIIELTPSAGDKKEKIADYEAQYGEAFDALLSEKIKEIFTPYEEGHPHGTFTQCTDDKHCAYCDFLPLCQRHPTTIKFQG